MNKKISLILVLSCLSACSSNRKLDYVITDSSHSKQPLWVQNIRKFEKNKENEPEKYRYFKAEGSSINKRLCEKSAIDNTNITIAGEINTEINNLYTGVVNVNGEETLINDDKKEETKSLIKNSLTGVEPREGYWEKRKYSTELGADKDKVVYYCYQLSRVKRTIHDKIIDEMVNKNLKKIKNESEKEEAKKTIEENAKKSDIVIDVK